MTLVANGPLREAYLKAQERGISDVEICRALGWVDKSGRVETVRLKRMLGIVPDVSGYVRNQNGGQPRFRKRMVAEAAAGLCREIGVDPIDVGL